MNSSVRREPRVNDFTNLSRSDLRSGAGESLSGPPGLDSLDILSTVAWTPRRRSSPCCQYRAPAGAASTEGRKVGRSRSAPRYDIGGRGAKARSDWKYGRQRGNL